MQLLPALRGLEGGRDFGLVQLQSGFETRLAATGAPSGRWVAIELARSMPDCRTLVGAGRWTGSGLLLDFRVEFVAVTGRIYCRLDDGICAAISVRRNDRPKPTFENRLREFQVSSARLDHYDPRGIGAHQAG